MAARSRRYFESACRWHTLAANWEERGLRSVAVFGQLWTSQCLRIYTIFSTSEINNTRRHPFVSRSFGRSRRTPLATFTLQRLIHLYQLSRQLPEFRAFRLVMAGKDQQYVRGCVSVWSHKRFTRNHQGVSHAKWLKANHTSAPIRPGAATQPVDVECCASRAEISKRAKDL